jgi:hypothetical protein
MSYRKSSRARNWIFAIFLMAGSLLLMGYAFYPTQYSTDSVQIPAGPLPAEYALTVRSPSFGQSDADGEVIVELTPSIPGGHTQDGIVAAEIQSVDLRLDPSGQVIAPLPAGRSVSFRWIVRGGPAGDRSFSLFLFSLATDGKPGDATPAPFWAHDFTWKTFSGLGESRPPVLVCATLMFLLGFGILFANLMRRRGAR